MSSRDNDDDKDSVIAGLEEKLRVAAKAKESRDRQFDVVAAKLDFVEKQMTEKTRETSRKQRKIIEALQKELNETKAERDDLLAIREQVKDLRLRVFFLRGPPNRSTFPTIGQHL